MRVFLFIADSRELDFIQPDSFHGNTVEITEANWIPIVGDQIHLPVLLERDWFEDPQQYDNMLGNEVWSKVLDREFGKHPEVGYYLMLTCVPL